MRIMRSRFKDTIGFYNKVPFKGYYGVLLGFYNKVPLNRTLKALRAAKGASSPARGPASPSGGVLLETSIRAP